MKKKRNYKNQRSKVYKKQSYDVKKTHRFWTKYYIDPQGNYVEKPWWANFWRVGFLDDIPTRLDYEREMDGIVNPNLYDRDGYLKDRYANSSLYGLERFQMSLNRLWNGSPREWIKLIFRVLLLLGFIAFVIAFGRILFGVSLDAPLFSV